MSKIRKNVVAGGFYPATENSLNKMVGSLLKKPDKNKEDVVGLLLPHAGYIYSGPVAGATVSSVKPKKHYIIIGPNHTGMGAQFGISGADAWQTPLGDVKVDKKLAACLLKECPLIKEDDLSSDSEHSVEVQLPFLQVIQKDFSFVPLVVSYADTGSYKKVGEAIARSVKSTGLKKDISIIASSDMTHYEAHEAAKKKDMAAIEAILKLDETGLMEAISRLDISMCGFAPCYIMLVAAKILGAKKARLAMYQTSGDTGGDYSSVVGYAGITVS